MKCPICKENSIEEDSNYGNVCTSCGYVHSENVFANNMELEGTTAASQSRNHVNFNVRSLPKSLQSENTIYISKGKDFGLNAISAIASYLRLQSVVKDEIVELFIKMINNDNFKFDHFPKKAALVACCTYIVLRTKNFPIMISHICNFLQCCSTNFIKIYNEVLKFANITITTPTIDELVPSILNSINLGDEKANIIPLVLRILHVACDCWITCGRTPQPYIIASGFIAWKSLSYERRKYSFTTFCKKVHVTQHHYTAAIRARELGSALMKLAEELPWREKGKVNIKDIPYMLDSILTHSELLRMSAIQWEDNNEQSNDCKEFQTFRAATKKRKLEVRDDDDDYSSSFDDTAINCYIRTEKEVRDLENFMKEKELT